MRLTILELITASDIDRFWSRVLVGDNTECWPWTGYTYRGYGRIWIGTKKLGDSIQTHQVAMFLTYGHPNDKTKYMVCHHCDSKPCCNPSHLFWGSAHDNKLDAGQKGLLPHQRYPLFRGERNQQAKLTENQVRSIKVDDRTQQAIANEYGVSRATISSIQRGINWNHIQNGSL